MKLKDERPDVLVSGNLDEITFSIDNDSEHIIFDILRSKLYKNNIGAICREVASNSRDAQREILEFKRPTEVEIIDSRDSLSYEDGINIIFRDFGIGISPERAKNIYTKYGASTKRDSNTQTGGFGLGAKTPFAYSDAFIVRTIVDNIEYVYSIYIDETKKGKMSLLSEQPIEHENMTEIVISLSPEDLYKFENEVIKNTQFWKVRPTLKGFRNNYFHLSKVDNNYSEDWKVEVYQDHKIFESPISAVVDGIIYPIDMNIVDLDNDFHFNEKICLFYDNGDLGISANRETLNYDKDTIEILKKKISEVFSKACEHYYELIMKSPNLFSAFVLFNKLKDQSGIFAISQEYNNIPFEYPVTIDGQTNVYDLKTFNFEPKRLSIQEMKYKSYEGTFDKNYFSKKSMMTWTNHKNINISSNTYVGELNNVEINKRLKVGINRKIYNTQGNFVIIMPSSYESVYTTSPEYMKECEEDLFMFKQLGFNIDQKYFDVEPEKIVRKNTVKADKYLSVKVVDTDRDCGWEYKQYIIEDKKVDWDTTSTSLYHIVPEGRATPDSALEMCNVLVMARKLGVKNIYLVPLSKMKYFKGNNFMSVDDWLLANENKVRNYIRKKELVEEIAKVKDYLDLLHPDASEQKLFDEVVELIKVELLSLPGENKYVKGIIAKFDNDEIKQFINKVPLQYPLMREYRFKDIDIRARKEYIRMVNELNNYRNKEKEKQNV